MTVATSSTLIGVRRDKEVIIAPTVDVLTGQAKHLQEYKSYKKKLQCADVVLGARAAPSWALRTMSELSTTQSFKLLFLLFSH